MKNLIHRLFHIKQRFYFFSYKSEGNMEGFRIRKMTRKEMSEINLVSWINSEISKLEKETGRKSTIINCSIIKE